MTGGQDPQNTINALEKCFKINIVNGLLTEAKSMSTARLGHALVMFRGNAVAINGWSKNTLDSCETYDQGEWLQFEAKTIVARHSHSAAVLQNKFIYIFGGMNEDSDPKGQGSLEKYDHDEKKWTLFQVKELKEESKEPVPLLIWGWKAVAVSDTEIFLTGGKIPDFKTGRQFLFKFD